MPRSPRSLPDREEIERVLADRIPDYRPGEPFDIVARLSTVHDAYHAIVVRAAQIIRALRAEPLNLTWRQIDALTGIEQSTARRWIDPTKTPELPAEDWKP